MKRICCYCNANLGSATFEDGGEEKISHGICRKCLGQIMKGLGQPLAEYLDSLDVPVFVVDGEGRVVCASKSAQVLETS